MRIRYVTQGRSEASALDSKTRSFLQRSSVRWDDEILGFVPLIRSKCLESRGGGEYHYTVCPFRSVTQRSRKSRKSIVLGNRLDTFLRADDDNSEAVHKLVMTGGESRGCPNKRPRRVIFLFRCSAQADRVISIVRHEVCSTVEIGTCAACVV